MDKDHWTFAREIFKGEVLNNEFIHSDKGNFFAHNVFPFALQKSATISLKTYGSKIMSKPCSLKTEEVNMMINNEISPGTEQVLIGSLLGDGGLVLPKNGFNAYFGEMHSVKQREYLKWKKKYFEFFNPKINESKILDNRTNKYYHYTLLWTSIHPLLTIYYNLLYKNNKKKVVRSILDKVGPLALAVWYCDDGSFGYINQNGKIATYLSYKDNLLLAEFLNEKFDIKCTVNKDGKFYHLYFSVKEIRKFLNLIKNYVPECMNYKLGPLSEDNSVRLKEENLKRRERDKIRHKRNMEDPIKHAKINKQKRENQRKRAQDTEYKKKQREYFKKLYKNPEYKKRRRENYRRRMQNPEYRGRLNEYRKIKQREYRKKKNQSGGA